MLQQIKKQTALLFAMLLCIMPDMAHANNNETIAVGTSDSVWVLAITGIVLGSYKIYRHGIAQKKTSSVVATIAIRKA